MKRVLIDAGIAAVQGCAFGASFTISGTAAAYAIGRVFGWF